MHNHKASFVCALFLMVAAQLVPAQTFTVLYSFTGQADGANPYGGVIRDTAGNLYGTTRSGGSSNYGTVFKIETTGAEVVLHSFTGPRGDGAYPYAGLVRDKAGNLYGTTYLGGSSDRGTVFKLDTNGKETVLHSFRGGAKDGANPYGSLIWDGAQTFYGTTYFGGTFGYGTLFKVDTGGRHAVLHSFAGGARDGAYPYYTELLMDKMQNLYGLTMEGGTSNFGTIYKFSKSGRLTVLHSFAGDSTDGCYPVGAPIMDGAGNLYGTTNSCGSSNFGTVWALSSGGADTMLHDFAGGNGDGAYPLAGVIRDSNGNLYGTTEEGGYDIRGTVYELDKSGHETLLHSFNYNPDGVFPFDGVIRDADGVLYGTAAEGGPGGYGTVWELSP